jgi:diamine N-acetyltransferase
MLDKEVIQHDRIRLRPATEADLDFVMEMEGTPENSPFVRHWSIQQHQSAISDNNIAHLIVENSLNNKPIGYIILVGLENPDQSIEFKRIVVKEKNEGLGRESVRLIKKMAFGDLGAHRLWLEVMEHNDRAIKLYQSEGFTYEGLHRESLKQGEKFISLKVMSILAHEYKK